MSALIELTELGFAWPGQAELLDIPAFTLQQGESLFLKGPSGSGKTTLLAHFRVDRAGFIFQQFNLLPFLSVRENVELPCHFSKLRTQRAQQRHGSVSQAASALLSHLGLVDPALQARRADSLSIGQQQRVAAARALIGQPELVIADEPTSALDSDAREAFLQLLFAECRAAGSSLLFVSHDQSLAPLFDRSLSLSDLNRASRPSEL